EALWHLIPGAKQVKGEVTHGESRLDFCVETDEDTWFVEVKGVTLEKDGHALFPDAPTERGIKHLHTLIQCVEEGHKAAALFVIQMKGVHSFSPHDLMHPAFGGALREAAAKGVEIWAYDCLATEKEMTIDQPVPVKL
ncbi:MAG: DNA/RNA nuclease SfsA, partial [Clostridia bacterium]|nr:DNA/RNA nuclease SfsA [Clostridia bacterium]